VPRIVLFDLDGTVLTFEGRAPGPGRTALERAMVDLYAVDDATKGLRMAGGTDLALARTMLERVGVRDDDRAIEGVLGAYVVHLEAILRTRRYRPIGDVANVVETLRARGVTVGAATGNVRAGARLKLASAGLAESFDLDQGAYGDDAEARADIVRLAAERCGAACGTPIVVVGDTRYDVLAGRAVGARVVGVAINDEARAELAAAGASAIVAVCGDDLVEAILA
jgi:phosphoglycolate phosphatase